MGRLFWKIFLAFWGCLLLASGIVGFGVWLHRPSHEHPPIAHGPGAAIVIQMAAAALETTGDTSFRELASRLEQERKRENEPLILHAIDKNGYDLLGHMPNATLQQQAAAIADSDNPRRVARRVRSAEGQDYLLYLEHSPSSFPPPPGVPGFGPPPPPMEGGNGGSHERFFISPAIALIGSGLLASLVFSIALAWYLSRPIKHLRSAFHSLAKGDMATRVAPMMGRRRDELADLGLEFDRTSHQLQLLMTTQQRLLHDVSHELRSPLARLHAAISLAQQDPAKLTQTLARVELEAHRLDQLVGELLTLARLESDTAPLPLQQVDLYELVAGIVDDARLEGLAQSKSVELTGPQDIWIVGSTELLFRAFENPIRNAVKHTQVGTTVHVRIELDAQKNKVLITVADHGPGVGENELELIFEAFYRGEQMAPTSSSGNGFGLGLAIARRAVLTHGGEITAKNLVHGGLMVSITLPIRVE